MGAMGAMGAVCAEGASLSARGSACGRHRRSAPGRFDRISGDARWHAVLLWVLLIVAMLTSPTASAQFIDAPPAAIAAASAASASAAAAATYLSTQRSPQPHAPPSTAMIQLRENLPDRLDLATTGQMWIERGAGAAAIGPHAAPLPPQIPDSAWEPLARARLTPGYTRDAYWLRWTLHETRDTPQRHVLMLDPARIESVTLYQRRLWPGGGAEAWRISQAGTDLPFTDRPLPLRESAFAMTLETGETRELWLRVASRSSLAVSPSLWVSEALVDEQQWRVMRDGMLSAAGLTLALLAAGLAVSLRDRGYGWIAAFLFGAMVYEMTMRGTAFARFWPDGTDWAQRALGTTGALTTMFQIMALSAVLRLAQTQPRVYRAIQVVIALGLVAVAVCIWGDYQLGTRLAGPVNLGLSLLGLAASIRAARRRDPVAGVWLCALVGVMLGMAPRYASLLGFLPHASWVDLAPSVVGTAGALAVIVAMLRLLMQERRRHAEALEAAVAERTAELARASAHAQASDAAKGRLLGHMGHDLRAPLASMVQLTRRLRPGRDFESHRQAIEHGGLMLLDTIDELQRFARSPNAEADTEIVTAPVYLYGLLHELALQSQSLMLASTNRLNLQMDPNLPPVVEVDARRLRQVMLNLLSNAAKYSRAGEIAVRARATPDGLTLSVIDHGPGMTAEELARVFEPFMRGRAAHGVPGLGLGLSIAQQTVRAMGGDLSASSAPGRGACFTVALPLVAAEEPQVQWPRLTTQGLESLGEGWAAVVWDETPGVRDVLLERLLQCGFEASAAEQADEVVDQLQAASDEGLGLLLVSSPEALPSPQWLGLLRARWPRMRTLLCTAHARSNWPSDDRLAVMPKPAPQELWVPVLKRLCPPVDVPA
ncbi:hybrid sensor histidine kinase/response regulator [Roseateles amylovorans]|uniref:histidine kinase n=1 Tax=Roseateles amylovorans TaxID=2978473 RepID=A0ABY6B7M2_9BURK|nr:ATP-binding protein [Roseateles amylovorans]UXH80839.1 ATP-binding protein [Roseateles amylovorans]